MLSFIILLVMILLGIDLRNLDLNILFFLLSIDKNMSLLMRRIYVLSNVNYSHHILRPNYIIKRIIKNTLPKFDNENQIILQRFYSSTTDKGKKKFFYFHKCSFFIFFLFVYQVKFIANNLRIFNI